MILDYEGISSDGTLLNSFGRRGKSCGESQNPSGIAFDTLGNIVVADSAFHRVHVFDGNCNFLRTFGERMGLVEQLSYPKGLSINSNGDIIVADTGNGSIKIFSRGGKCLRKFGSRGSLFAPCDQ